MLGFPFLYLLGSWLGGLAFPPMFVPPEGVRTLSFGLERSPNPPGGTSGLSFSPSVGGFLSLGLVTDEGILGIYIR